MASEEQRIPTNTTRIAASALVALEVILFGVFIILTSVGANHLFGLDFKNVWLESVLVLFFLMCLTQGLLRRNNYSVWLGFVFFTCALVTILVKTTDVTYGQLYPLYIAIPAISSFFTLFLSRAKGTHLKAIIFFGAIALIFFLNSVFKVDWPIIIAVLVIAIGGMAFISIITRRRGRWDDGDRPQRKRNYD